MILRSNLPRLRERASASARVLDVGGWYQPFNLATHVIDLRPYESRRVHDALDPGDGERFSAATWVVHDVCNAPWPFLGKSFDFVVCSHSKERWSLLKRLAGNGPEIGFRHHRWFVEREGTHLRLTAKTAALLEARQYYLTRNDIGRNLYEHESALALFWVGEFTFEEVFTDIENDYSSFQRKAMDMLKK